MPNTRLTKQQVTATDRKKFTFSFWFKRGMDAGETEFIYESVNDSSNRFYINLLEPSDTLEIINKNSGSNVLLLRTTRAFRDVSAWYHLVLAVDTDQSTAADRNKLYINGERITSFSTETNFSSGVTGAIGTSSFYHTIGGYSGGGAYYAGSMSFFALVDGTQEVPTIFGETDSTTGQWKIKANITPSSGWGDNGFLILKNGNSLTDESTNSNNFALATGTLTDTKDCPDNNFATLNPLDVSLPSTFTLQYGNLENLTLTSVDVGGNNTYGRAFSTLQVASGKFYAEMKWVNTGSAGMVAVTSRSGVITSQYAYLGKQNEDWRYYHDGTKMNNNSSSSYGDSQANGDIVGVALDLDNLKIYFSKNGTWQNSGNPASGSTGTGAAFTLTAPNLTSNGAYKFGIGTQGGQNVKGTWNFGNGYFGTSAITTNSGNGYAGAEGASKFNYQPPSGYSALNTKGLNQ